MRAHIPARPERPPGGRAVQQRWLRHRAQQRGQSPGVNTVLDLARLSPALVRSRWGVVLERTVRELQGQPCIELVDAPPAKQQIACTRSFGRPITEQTDLIEAISEFASRAAEKLRRQSGLAGQVPVFAHTSPFRPGPVSQRASSCPCADPLQIQGIWFRPQCWVPCRFTSRDPTLESGRHAVGADARQRLTRRV